jgi:hypothetical protein
LYDPATGLWTDTTWLTAAREDHTVTLLANGKVLAAGGWNGTSTLASAELYSEHGVDISGNAGVGGAILSYTDGTSKTATSAAGGRYSFTVSYNWSGTVTPSKTGYTFSPVNRSYTKVRANQTGQNYTSAATPPAAPTSVKASDGTYTNKVRVSWNASSGATSYKVYRATSVAGTKSLLGSSTGTSFNDTTATPGVTYRYWVKACRSSRCSSYSAGNNGWRKLSPPTGVSASDGTYINKVRVTWNAASGATSYKVYRATSATGTKSLLGSPTGTSFNDTTATPGVTYYYWVKACRSSRCSSYSTRNKGWRQLSPPTGVNPN